MARAKRPSDELYNARRRAKRLAERLERSGDTRAASDLRQLVSASYGKGATIGVEQLRSAVTAPVPDRQRAQRPREGTHVPRPKRPSDELYNARRRLRRQAERLEREAKNERGRAKELAEGFARYLRQQAEAGKKMDTRQRLEEIGRLGRIRDVTRGVDSDRFRVRRRNAIFIQQMNAAGTEGAESSISERKKDVFWAATKGLWPKGSNVPRNERYERILEHFFMDNTTDAREFREWLEREKDTTARESFGDLQLIYEYITEEMNDPSIYDLPDVPYENVMDLLRMAM